VLLGLLDDLLPLVESLLLELLQTAEVVILYVVLLVLSEDHISQVGSMNVNWLGAVLRRLQPRVLQCLLGCQSLAIVYLDQATDEIFGFIG